MSPQELEKAIARGVGKALSNFALALAIGVVIAKVLQAAWRWLV